MTAVPELSRPLRTERTMVRVRWAGVAFGLLQVLTYYLPYPPNIRALALGLVAVLAGGNIAIWAIMRMVITAAGLRRLSLGGLILDTAITLGFAFVYTFDQDTAIWALIYILPLEGAIRFQMKGAMLAMAGATILYIAREIYGADVYGNDFLLTSISFRMGLGFIIAGVSGATTSSLVNERADVEKKSELLAEARKIAGFGSWEWNIASGEMTWSDEMYSHYGYESQEFPASLEKAMEAVVPEDVEQMRQNIEIALGQGVDHALPDFEFRVVLPNGEERCLFGRGRMIFSGENPIRLVGTVQDITERKLAEKRLQEAYDRERDATERLREVDEMKTAFMAAVSHELRTPLTAILGFAKTLERALPGLSSEDAQAMVGRISTNSEKLKKMLAELVDVDRLSRGTVEPDRLPTNLADLARTALDGLDLQGRTVEVDTPSLMASVDAVQVERILDNLLANAVKHTPAGTSIGLKISSEDKGILIAVSDDGPGVPDGLKEAIFEPFRQGDGPHPSGTGIGLSLVSKFAQLHGGKSWVQDRPGGGACFNVFLPDSEIKLSSSSRQ